MKKKLKSFTYINKITGEECTIEAENGPDASLQLLNSMPEHEQDQWLIA